MLLTDIFSSAILLVKSEMSSGCKKQKHFLEVLYMKWFLNEDELDEFTENDENMSDVALAYMWAFHY